MALLILGLFTIFTLAATAACTPAPAPATEETPAEEHSAEEEHSEEEGHEHSEGEEHGDRLPNEGAVIRIVSPADGATIAGTEVEVTIAVENFELGEDGRHWHIYVDGEAMGMVGGGDTTYVLRALEPGEHTIEAYMGLGTHEELEHGASVTVTLEG
jgi:hypothetical protein